MARKQKYKAKSFESKGEKYELNGKKRADTSANIYDSMMLSAAFKDLKARQKCLYLVCKAQYYGKRKPEKDYPEHEQLHGDDKFYINLSVVVEYGLYTNNMRKEFYGDLKALEEHGFIEKVAQGGGNGKTKSVWKYSAKWHEWQHEK